MIYFSTYYEELFKKFCCKEINFVIISIVNKSFLFQEKIIFQFFQLEKINFVKNLKKI